MKPHMGILVAWAALALVTQTTAIAGPTTTAFTYQGVLRKNGTPMNSASVNLRFRLFDAASAGNVVGNPVTISALPVQNGLVTVPLDFGITPFDGSGRWLEISVQDQGEGNFTTLSPLQAITPAPYSLRALSADAVLTLPFSGAGSAASTAAFLAENNDAATTSHGVEGLSHSGAQNSSGVWGENVATAGNTVGVYGLATASPTGTGIVGVGKGTGAYFRGDKPSGTGVIVATQDGSGFGLKAEMTTGIGVYGLASATGGVGGYFSSFNGGIPLYVDGMAQMKGVKILGGADLAEHFPVRESAGPGTVLVLDPESPGRLRISDRADDPAVAGVVSGANGLAAGITLSDGVNAGTTAAIALTGRVWVKADARAEPIRVGDRLTTSDLPGHARRAGARAVRRGAILGKAMSALDAGTGEVLVLVQLQ